MSEAETHAEHIDPALKAAGWGVVEGSRVRRDTDFAACGIRVATALPLCKLAPPRG